MQKMLLILTIQVAVLLAQAGDMAVMSAEGWREDFTSFEGSSATLPTGMIVSKNGLDAMLPDDLDYRGVSSGGVTAGGCYAWDLGGGDKALGYQPTEDEFTPGYFHAAVSNASGQAVSYLKIEYEVVCLNNGGRASALRLMFAVDGATLTPVEGLDFISEEPQDSNPQWSRVKMGCLIKLNKPLDEGESFALRWVGDDAGGSGSRDEYGLSYVSVKGIKTRGFVLTVR